MSTFSTSSRQKKAQNPQLFTLLTSKCASRHNGVHFFDTFSTSEPPKVVRDRQFFTLLTWKCASRHNGVHFFDIATSKSRPTLRCFLHFHFEMCFAPQRRALFWHLNFQKCPTLRCFVHFDLEMCFAPQRRTRRFSEPTFRPSWATNHWKNTVFRDFPTFSRICIFCPLTLSLLLFSLLIFLFSLPLPYSAFHLSILSEVWLLNFLRSVYISLCISVYISLCISVYISCIMLCVIVCPFQLVFIREPRLRLPHWVPHKTAHRVEVRPRKFCRPPSAICKHQTCTEIWDIVRHCVTIIFKIHQNYP